MKRFAAIFIAFALSIPTLFAGGIDPSRDSLSVAAYRARMDSIRVAAGRPTVALVLSGGGAKGAAHAGVLRYIEELNIPVDVVLGTSMGGLMGGLFAAGYSSDEIEEILTSADWKRLLYDKTPLNFINYSERRYREKYQLAIPFFYDKEDYKLKIEDDLKFSPHRHGTLSLASTDEVDENGPAVLRKDNMWESLPSGYTSGQNVNNLLSSLLVGYEDYMDFSKLPIPFICVASDVVSLKAKVWYEGKLVDAMRSTMSIPVLFTPVRTDGMVLLDGGMRNNYPVDIARNIGADIVIGVELSDRSKNYAEVNNIGDILSQLIDMLSSNTFEENVNAADVKIKPDLHEYNMLSFDDESIRIIVNRGYSAAGTVVDQLADIRAKLGRDSLKLNSHPAVNFTKDSVYLSEIKIAGVTEKEEAVLMKKVGFGLDKPVSQGDVDHLVQLFYGTRSFDYVSYNFIGTDSPYGLRINCKKGPIHQFGIGIRLDTEEIVSAMINVGLWTRKLYGHNLDMTAKISANPYLKVSYSYDGPKTPTFELSTLVGWTDLSKLAFTSEKMNLSYLRWISDLSISNIKWYNMDLSLGLRNRMYNMRSVLNYDVLPDKSFVGTGFFDYVGLFFDGHADTYDHGYFPNRGFRTNLKYEWDFYGTEGGFSPFHTLSFDATGVVPAPRVFAFIPYGAFRFVFGDSIPQPFLNYMGGSMAGRYFDHQFAFMGINHVRPVGNIFTMLRFDFRFNTAKNHYITAIVDYERDSKDFKSYLVGPGNFGAGIEYAYNTILGPLKADVHWSTITNKPGFYISAGLNF